MLKTFRGGVHPDDKKSLVKDCAIQAFPPPARATVLMSQHLGAPCKPAVTKGQRVLTGQEIGAAQGFVSAPIHAPVTGKVVEIGQAYHPVTGRDCPAVIIERDGEDEWAPGLNTESDPSALSGDEIRARILAAGIVGLGGATFPTHVKLSPPQGKPIDTVILNAAECEPYLACDYRLMMEKPAEVMEGFRLIMKVLGVSRGLVGVEANKSDAAEKLRAVSGGVQVQMVQVKYPQGAEAQMIRALLGREVPWKGGLPMDAGCVVQNVATAYAVYEALRLGRPLIQRVCSVTGEGVERPANYLVRVGTPLSDVVAAAGIKPSATRLILGGPMMGLAQGGRDIFCAKGTSGVLALCDGQPKQAGPCIRCGACVRACPCGLTPALISRAVEAGDFDACLALNTLECKQCGCCTYACPAHRPLMHQLKLALDELRRRKAEADAKAKAQAAKAAV